ncbi:MAG: DUF6456 domain-containing protein [Pseudomonadota bacterium]|uniref:DUF6456 domain-containing protein n=1 Tax=Roseovarius TaxID=74030 RepID=UPI0022A72B91|nr:DUF6456 domain-containing protein [Roseovarius sp. EGI FJ00037]MCZ0811041.1 DUF6456 domain-containing protein [Roseovarius sp. EGI FJ00037]
MKGDCGGDEPLAGVPGWLPQSARHYLAHIEAGTPIRALARRAGCHASTVLRQIRACEAQRDDILVDAALRRLGRRVPRGPDRHGLIKETWDMDGRLDKDGALPTEDRLSVEARRILRRLCETGAVLAVAADMEKAVVLRDNGSGETSRAAVVDRAVAEAMALKQWIACETPGRVSRYRITAAGRAEIRRMLARDDTGPPGCAEAPGAFAGPARAVGLQDPPASRRIRYGAAETPLIALARRRDRDGQRFLAPDLVRAGERLREDYDLSGLGARRDAPWDRFVMKDMAQPEGLSPMQVLARARVLGALRDLGPGLGDVALRCCCYLEGLETAEKRLGWSARSGKIVLRIALQRLKRHYEGLNDGSGLIG